MSDEKLESPDRMQYRLLMEQRTAEIFMGFMETIRPRCPITIISYTINGPGDWVAWKTTFNFPAHLRETLQAILDNWEGKKSVRRITVQEAHRLHLPDSKSLMDWSDRIKNMANDSTFGFSLIAGKGKKYQYMSNGDRESVVNIIKSVRSNAKW